MTDASVEAMVELAVAAQYIADEYADTLRPKQVDQLYRMSAVFHNRTSQAQTIAALRSALEEYERREADGVKYAELELSMLRKNPSVVFDASLSQQEKG